MYSSNVLEDLYDLMVLIFGLKIGQIFTINCEHTLIALFSGANTLAPLSHTDLPRHLRSTRRLSVCNEQIMMELQQKMHNPSSNPDGSSSKRLVRVWAKQYKKMPILQIV